MASAGPYMQICTLPDTDNHTSNLSVIFYKPFLQSNYMQDICNRIINN